MHSKSSNVKPTPIDVEFFGVARLAAGLTYIEVLIDMPTTLGKIIHSIDSLVPGAAGGLLVDEKLAPGIIINIDGRRFETDLSTEINSAKSVILMSIDVGG